MYSKCYCLPRDYIVSACSSKLNVVLGICHRQISISQMHTLPCCPYSYWPTRIDVIFFSRNCLVHHMCCDIIYILSNISIMTCEFADKLTSNYRNCVRTSYQSGNTRPASNTCQLAWRHQSHYLSKYRLVCAKQLSINDGNTEQRGCL